MTKNKFVRPSFKARLKIQKKTEFFQNLIFFTKYKDKVIFSSKSKLSLNLKCNFGEFLD
jgi:hypothetical protein